MQILLSNDDGYQAPGIHYLAEALSEFAEVIIIAPDRNRSGASNSLTLDRPLQIREARKNVYYVNGTPTDCVHLALTGFLDRLPDMVLSGINDGANLGDDVLYSGTVAAAVQGRFLGFPSMAFSLAGDAKHYMTAAHVAKELVMRMRNHPLPASTILNVNIPDVPLNELGEHEIVRLGKRYLADNVIRQVDPRGREVYWVGLPGPEDDAGPGTDFSAIREGNVAITPLRIDWSNYTVFEDLSNWLHKAV